jgi:hypothetical protein
MRNVMVSIAEFSVFTEAFTEFWHVAAGDTQHWAYAFTSLRAQQTEGLE